MSNLSHSKTYNNKTCLKFSELPFELSILFVRRTAVDLFISIILIIGCFYFRSKQMTALILLAIAIINIINFLFYSQLMRGQLNVLDAVCVKMNVSHFKLLRSDSKVELLLKNDKYYYTLNTSKHMAKNIAENMKVRIYVTSGNAYKKSDEQVVILNPILISPLAK